MNTENTEDRDNQNNNNSKNLNKPGRTVRNRSLTLYVINIFIIIAFIGFGYLGYNQVNYINNKINGNNHIIIDLKDKLMAVESYKVTNDDKLHNIKLDLTENNKLLNSLEANLIEFKKINKNPELKLEIFSIKNLINQANNQLKLNNLDNTIRILQVASAYINNTKQAELIKLRQDIVFNIENLNKIKQPDILKLNHELINFENKIDSVNLQDIVKFNIDNTSNIINAELEDSNLSNHNIDQVITRLKQNLSSIIKIRTVSDSQINNILTDEQLFTLKLIFKLKISKASNNLANNRFRLYSANYEDLLNNTKKYFIRNDELLNNLLDVLDKASLSKEELEQYEQNNSLSLTGSNLDSIVRELDLINNNI